MGCSPCLVHSPRGVGVQRGGIGLRASGLGGGGWVGGVGGGEKRGGRCGPSAAARHGGQPRGGAQLVPSRETRVGRDGHVRRLHGPACDRDEGGHLGCLHGSLQCCLDTLKEPDTYASVAMYCTRTYSSVRDTYSTEEDGAPPPTQQAPHPLQGRHLRPTIAAAIVLTCAPHRRHRRRPPATRPTSQPLLRCRTRRARPCRCYPSPAAACQRRSLRPRPAPLPPYARGYPRIGGLCGPGRR